MVCGHFPYSCAVCKFHSLLVVEGLLFLSMNYLCLDCLGLEVYTRGMSVLQPEGLKMNHSSQITQT